MLLPPAHQASPGLFSLLAILFVVRIQTYFVSHGSTVGLIAGVFGGIIILLSVLLVLAARHLHSLRMFIQTPICDS